MGAHLNVPVMFDSASSCVLLSFVPYVIDGGVAQVSAGAVFVTARVQTEFGQNTSFVGFRSAWDGAPHSSLPASAVPSSSVEQVPRLFQNRWDSNTQNPEPYVGHVRSLSCLGHKGHRIIADIVEDQLTSETRKALRKLMGSDDIVPYATWADDIRHERPETAPWHYVDIPGDSSGYDAHRDCPESDCIVTLGRLRAIQYIRLLSAFSPGGGAMLPACRLHCRT
jgi:hypothetical protein